MSLFVNSKQSKKRDGSPLRGKHPLNVPFMSDTEVMGSKGVS